MSDGRPSLGRCRNADAISDAEIDEVAVDEIPRRLSRARRLGCAGQAPASTPRRSTILHILRARIEVDRSPATIGTGEHRQKLSGIDSGCVMPVATRMTNAVDAREVRHFRTRAIPAAPGRGSRARRRPALSANTETTPSALSTQSAMPSAPASSLAKRINGDRRAAASTSSARAKDPTPRYSGASSGSSPEAVLLGDIAEVAQEVFAGGAVW